MSNIVPSSPANIARAGEILRGGGLVAFPTETVYGLGANALDPAAVRRIFAAKERPDWDPLIVHVASVAMAESLATGLPVRLMQQFWPGPLTLVVPKKSCMPDAVTAGRPNVALRMPRHPVAQALLAVAGCPIAAPSANKFGRPSPTTAQHVADDLGDRVGLILDAGPTEMGVESTVLDCTQSPPVILRPGGVTREQLGELRVAGSVADEAAAQGLAGPGMTVKHYAPRATVELFEDQKELLKRGAELHRQGKETGLLIVADAQELARVMFAELRRFDGAGAEVILALLPPATGIGLAVRDRLRRASGLAGKDGAG
jgi:L-threonylcarbamoyladenylate synthase